MLKEEDKKAKSIFKFSMSFKDRLTDFNFLNPFLELLMQDEPLSPYERVRLEAAIKTKAKKEYHDNHPMRPVLDSLFKKDRAKDDLPKKGKARET